jgi:hypothetical protein
VSIPLGVRVPHSGGMADFDLVRITKAKKEVDVSTSTIREYARQGLGIYKQGKAAFFSKTELAQFIRTKGAQARFRTLPS